MNISTFSKKISEENLLIVILMLPIDDIASIYKTENYNETEVVMLTECNENEK